MKFKMDENLPGELAHLLTKGGYDAKTVYHEQLQGISDKSLLEICAKEERILITLDMDFADILMYPPQNTPGIVVLRIAKQDKETVLSTIRNILPNLKSDRLEHKLWIVEESRIRVHGE